MSGPDLPQPARLPQPLHGAHIHVWFCELGAGRADAQAFLRRVLAAYLGHAVDAADLHIGAYGKPALVEAGLQFNLSHSRGGAVVALAHGIELGVDLERAGRRRPHAELARRFFCAAEAQHIESLPDAAREAAFLRLWTAKEAVLKAIGRGLAFGLDKLEFDLACTAPRLTRIAAAGGAVEQWQVQALHLPPPWHAHLAWHGPACDIAGFHDVTPSSPLR